MNNPKALMIDIETTGIDPLKEDLLQVALVEVEFTDGLWRADKHFVMYQHTNRAPISQFAREHMADLYKKCNDTIYVKPDQFRIAVLEFAKSCGLNPPDIKFMGHNAGIFDVPFLVEKHILLPSTYKQVQGPNGVEDKRIGDFHYRVYDSTGAIEFTKNLYNTDSIDDIKAKMDLLPADRYKVELPAGKEHDALFDCIKQINFLNDLLMLVRNK